MLLGVSSAPLGRSWRPLGSLLGTPGGVLAHLRCLVGRWEGPDGAIIAILGRSWDPLERYRGLLEHSWGLLEASWKALGSIWDAFESIWTEFGISLEAILRLGKGH